METTAQVLSRCYNPLNSEDSKLIVERRRNDVNDVNDVNCSMIKASHESLFLWASISGQLKSTLNPRYTVGI